MSGEGVQFEFQNYWVYTFIEWWGRGGGGGVGGGMGLQFESVIIFYFLTPYI